MSVFKKEADLCAAFMECVPPSWKVYPETGGFDILLARVTDGVQIGVEAKLRLNPKVITQAMESPHYFAAAHAGPDHRAVLVPQSAVNKDLLPICDALGIQVIRMAENLQLDADGKPQRDGHLFKHRDDIWTHAFLPRLPSERRGTTEWFDFFPAQRIALPDYIPDVRAGSPAPVQLTEWKVAAIKLSILLDRRGYVTRKDLRGLRLSPTRWTAPGYGYLKSNGSGGWVRTDRMPDLRAQHPINYTQIEADFESWSADLEKIK